MAFMQPQIIEGEWATLENEHGETRDIPAEYVDDKEPGESLELMHRGFGARLSAPGYMDCTEWAVFDTEQEAREYLAETYDLCVACLAELDPEFQCSECAEQ